MSFHLKRSIKKNFCKLPLIRELYFRDLRKSIAGARYVFFHSITGNIGDLKSCPYEYFDFFRGEACAEVNNGHFRKYIYACGTERVLKMLEGKTAIFGGGGLIEFERHDNHTRTLEILAAFASRGGRVVIWGAGHNRIFGFEKWLQEKGQNCCPPYFSKFTLVGTRDYPPEFEWIPCVSCMDPAFDDKFEEKYDYVAFLHGQESDKLRYAFENIPSLGNIDSEYQGNPEQGFRKSIEFIGSGRTLLTNSYHGLYWGTLLGKKVIAMPNSSKFLSFKYSYARCDDLTQWQSYTENIPSHASALQECRAVNLKFFDKVKSLA